MKAYFHCIGIMLVICQDVSAYYICYIDIYLRSYESLFSLCWHNVRNMSSRMNFLKVFCKGSAKKKRYMLFENGAYRVNLNNNVVFADLSTYELWKNEK